MTRTKKILGAVAAVAVVLLSTRIAIVRSFDEPLAPPLAVIGKLPVTLPNGDSAILANSLRPDLPTIVVLWASWCGPCQREAPKIADLRRRFGSEKLNLVLVNVRDSFASSRERALFLTRSNLPTDSYVVLDETRLRALTNDPKDVIPRMLVFDRAGRPLATIIGYKPLALNRVAGLIAR